MTLPRLLRAIMHDHHPEITFQQPLHLNCMCPAVLMTIKAVIIAGRCQLGMQMKA